MPGGVGADRRQQPLGGGWPAPLRERPHGLDPSEDPDRASVERQVEGRAERRDHWIANAGDGGRLQAGLQPGDIILKFDGRDIGEGRNLGFAGDSNTRYDTANRIQIVVEGHFDQEQPAAAQLRSLDRLVVWLAARHAIPAAKISGHADHVGDTDCPGKGLKTYLPTLRAKVAQTSLAR